MSLALLALALVEKLVQLLAQSESVAATRATMFSHHLVGSIALLASFTGSLAVPVKNKGKTFIFLDKHKLVLS